MQKSFTIQPELFVSSTDLEHPVLHALDDTESLLDWTQIEHLLSSIYASQTGRPSYPLLTLFRSLLLGVWYRLSDVQLAQCPYRQKGRSCGHNTFGLSGKFQGVQSRWHPLLRNLIKCGSVGPERIHGGRCC